VNTVQDLKDIVEEQQRKAVGEDLNLDVSLPAHPSNDVCACETGWWGAVERQIQQPGWGTG
jgi:hypothetical protein